MRTLPSDMRTFMLLFSQDLSRLSPGLCSVTGSILMNLESKFDFSSLWKY